VAPPRSCTMSPQLQAKLNNIVWRLHERRGRMTENVDMRKRYIESCYVGQIAADRQLLESRIARLQPSLQREFLENQLRKISRADKE